MNKNLEILNTKFQHLHKFCIERIAKIIAIIS